jgi:hypothetical protein
VMMNSPNVTKNGRRSSHRRASMSGAIGTGRINLSSASSANSRALETGLVGEEVRNEWKAISLWSCSRPIDPTERAFALSLFEKMLSEVKANRAPLVRRLARSNRGDLQVSCDVDQEGAVVRAGHEEISQIGLACVRQLDALTSPRSAARCVDLCWRKARAHL